MAATLPEGHVSVFDTLNVRSQSGLTRIASVLNMRANPVPALYKYVTRFQDVGVNGWFKTEEVWGNVEGNVQALGTFVQRHEDGQVCTEQLRVKTGAGAMATLIRTVMGSEQGASCSYIGSTIESPRLFPVVR